MPKVSIIMPVFNAEETLQKTIQSIKAQTFDDFEVLMIDDFSTDGSLAIEERVASEDSRFRLIKRTENGGVAASRNTGLDNAKGEYIRFVDADDTIPIESTEGMINVAEKMNADLVIGTMQLDKHSTYDVIPNTQNLSKKKNIKKSDTNLIHSFSVCNKLFRKSVIDNKSLRFKALKHAEDGMFSVEFFVAANTIAGYDGIAYNYFRPVAFEKKTITQKRNVELLEDFLRSSAGIRDILQEAGLKGSVEELDYRVLATSLIDTYYRHIWQLDEAGEELLLSNLEEFWGRASAKRKARILERKSELHLQEGFLNREELSKAPEIVIAISPDISMKEKEFVCDSLYQQSLPFFSIYLSEKDRDGISDDYRDMKNIVYLPGDNWSELFNIAIDTAPKGTICCFMTEPLYFSGKSLINIVNKIRARKLKMISGRIKSRENNDVSNIDYSMVSNSFFDADYLKKKKFVFTGDEINDYIKLIRLTGFNYHQEITQLTDKTIEETDDWKEKDERLFHEIERNERTNNTPGIFEDLCCLMGYKTLPLKFSVDKKKVLYTSSVRRKMGGLLDQIADLKPKGYDARYDLKPPSVKRSKKELMALILHTVTSAYIIVEGNPSFLARYKPRDGQKIVHIEEIEDITKIFN